MHVHTYLRVGESTSLPSCLSTCLSVYLFVCLCLSVYVYICLSVCLSHRQQIEDCETEIQRLKELLKKREENERKYHGQLGPCPPPQLLPSPLLVNLSALETLRMTVLWPVY